jgi:hypothetical protein
MPFAMGKDEDHPDDLFGVEKVKSRSNTKLADHIAIYTKRSLSYESDVLNTLGSISTFFARGTRPVRQIWGVPISITEHFDKGQIVTSFPPDYRGDPSQTLAYNFT